MFADEQILLAGDVGSRFYVIAVGTVEAQAGAVIRRLARATTFGEIACCATSSARPASSPLRTGLLYVLGREDFLREP